MAVQTFYPVLSGKVTKTTLTNQSSSEIVFGPNCIFIVVGDQDFFLKVGNSGMAAAANTDLYIPAKIPMTFDIGSFTDRIKVFAAGTSANIYTTAVSRS